MWTVVGIVEARTQLSMSQILWMGHIDVLRTSQELGTTAYEVGTSNIKERCKKDQKKKWVNSRVKGGEEECKDKYIPTQGIY